MASRLGIFLNFCEARSSLHSEFFERIGINDSNAYDIAPHTIMDIFEFLYMLSVTEIKTGESMALLAEAHNNECQRLLTMDTPALTRLGLNRTKIKDSMFSDKNVKKLRSNFDLGGAIDQSDIARLLFKHMSRETARKALILFHRGGLVKRIDAGDSVLIQPNGQAEKLFEEYLIALMQPSAET